MKRPYSPIPRVTPTQCHLDLKLNIIHRPQEVVEVVANVQLRAKVVAVARCLQLPLTTFLPVVFDNWVEGPASHVILGENAVEFPNSAK